MSTKKITEFKLPAYSEIPNVGLYLEQTQKFIGEYLEPFTSFSITTSMISNYVKKKLIENPVKKQYYREQIAYLIFIAIAKSVLSLEDIQTLLTMQKGKWGAEEAYIYFVSQLMDCLNGEMHNDEEDELEKHLIKHIAITVAHKMLVDQIFAGLGDA